MNEEMIRENIEDIQLKKMVNAARSRIRKLCFKAYMNIQNRRDFILSNFSDEDLNS